MIHLWSELFSFANYGELLVLVRNSILAGAVLGLAGGLVGVFVMARDLPFAVHAISELSFAGGAAGLLFGIGVVEGSLVGSMARRPSDESDGMASVSKVARPKNCRRAACSRLS